MQHTVIVDPSVSPSRIEYSDVFNVAVPFIDCHLDEARGGKAAIVFDDTGETVNYMQLAERVNRCGNLLTSLAGEPEGRVLMVVKDCPEFFYLFWGAIKGGMIPVPVNTLLRADDYRHIIEDSDAPGWCTRRSTGRKSPAPYPDAAMSQPLPSVPRGRVP